MHVLYSSGFDPRNASCGKLDTQSRSAVESRIVIQSIITFFYKSCSLEDLDLRPLVLRSNLCEVTVSFGQRSSLFTHLLDDHSTHFMANQDSLIHCLPGDQRAHNTTRKSVSGRVSVYNQVLANLIHREDLDLGRPVLVLLRSADDDGALGTVRNDGGPLARCVGLGRDGERDCDRLEVLRLGKATCGCPCGGFSLVADNDVGERQNLVDLLLESERYKRCGEVEREDLEICPMSA